MPNDKITFFREWLPLDKRAFRILAVLADVGEFKGNLTDLCEYFSMTAQTRTRNSLRESIEKLYEAGFITCELSGRTYTLKIIPKADVMQIPREWLHILKKHEYESESVAWEQVLKLILWCMVNSGKQTTNQEIADDLNCSVSVIGYAKNVLEKEYAAIKRQKVSEKHGDSFRAIGHIITACAWWTPKEKELNFAE